MAEYDFNQWMTDWPNPIVKQDLQGDYPQEFLGLAGAMMFKLKTMMRLGGLNQFQMTQQTGDGSVITVRSVYGQDFINIITPAISAGKEEEMFNFLFTQLRKISDPPSSWIYHLIKDLFPVAQHVAVYSLALVFSTAWVLPVTTIKGEDGSPLKSTSYVLEKIGDHEYKVNRKNVISWDEWLKEVPVEVVTGQSPQDTWGALPSLVLSGTQFYKIRTDVSYFIEYRDKDSVTHDVSKLTPDSHGVGGTWVWSFGASGYPYDVTITSEAVTTSQKTGSGIGEKECVYTLNEVTLPSIIEHYTAATDLYSSYKTAVSAGGNVKYDSKLYDSSGLLLDQATTEGVNPAAFNITGTSPPNFTGSYVDERTDNNINILASYGFGLKEYCLLYTKNYGKVTESWNVFSLSFRYPPEPWLDSKLHITPGSTPRLNTDLTVLDNKVSEIWFGYLMKDPQNPSELKFTKIQLFKDYPYFPTIVSNAIGYTDDYIFYFAEILFWDSPTTQKFASVQGIIDRMTGAKWQADDVVTENQSYFDVIN